MDPVDYRFLEYSAKDNMKELRKKFNNGETVVKETPEKITYKEALEDILYFQFVMENGYSGYRTWGKDKFDKAFIELEKEFSVDKNEIDVNDFLNMVKASLDFIFDGHLAITTEKYGVGYYKPLRTYVSDLNLKEHPDGFLITKTDQILSFKNSSVRKFPTINNGQKSYLLGVRSYNEIKTLEVFIDGQKTIIPLHKINSDKREKLVFQEMRFFDKVAYIKSSTFLGDNQEDLDEIYKTGKELRQYSDVIWDLSNNRGGNAEFAKQFIKGLSGCCSDSNKTYQLESTLVHAKETGEIKDIPYNLKEIKEYEENDESNKFYGHLHIIINDSVASSGELAIIMTSCINNRTIYGCNTLGIGKFGDLLIYYLPNSKATIWCPHKIYENNIEESIGYEPDYWIDDSDPLSKLLSIIKKKMHYN